MLWYCAARCQVIGFLSVSGDGIFFDSQVWTGAKNLWVPICCKFVIVTACFYKVLKKYTHTHNQQSAVFCLQIYNHRMEFVTCHIVWAIGWALASVWGGGWGLVVIIFDSVVGLVIVCIIFDSVVGLVVCIIFDSMVGLVVVCNIFDSVVGLVVVCIIFDSVVGISCCVHHI